MTIEQLLPITVGLAVLVALLIRTGLKKDDTVRAANKRYEADQSLIRHLEATLAESREGCMAERAQHTAAMLEKIDSHRKEMESMIAGLHQACEDAIVLRAQLGVSEAQLTRITAAWGALLAKPEHQLELDPSSIKNPAECAFCKSTDLAIMLPLWRVSQDPAVDPVRAGHRLGCVQCLSEWSLAHNGVTFNVRPGPGLMSTEEKERTNLGAVGISTEDKVNSMARGGRPMRSDLRFRKPTGKRAASIEEDEDEDA